MDARIAARLVLHGALVFLAGLAAGFPFAFVILGTMPGAERAWHMAHLEGVLNGLLLIAVAAVGPRLSLTARQGSALGWSLVITAWSNVLASILGAAAGVRGLTFGESAANTMVYVLFMVAVVTVVVALVLLALGARHPTA